MFSSLFGVFFSHLIQIFDSHVDRNRAQPVLIHLSCEVTLYHTIPLTYTFVKPRLVVIDIFDVDQYFCRGSGLDPVDVYFGLSRLK